MTKEEEHFRISQETERENLKIIFDNYFAKRNCTHLTLTSASGHCYYDAGVISAMTRNLVIEYKRRSIKVFDGSDWFLEWPKNKNRHAFHLAGTCPSG